MNINKEQIRAELTKKRALRRLRRRNNNETNNGVLEKVGG